ncbi:MAG: cell surface protein, partial [Verrucomicrobia bacterium]|nr:cell surface protein [Verrucomicrobiota bacterium]
MNISPAHRVVAALAAAFAFAFAFGAAAPASAERLLTRVDVFPSSVTLWHARDRQSVVVQATYSDGVTRDVTTGARYQFANTNLARLAGNLVAPIADGKTELKIDFEGQSAAIPIEIRDATKERPVSFRNDVMPVFMRAGCNAGSCHGAARGKDGFRLSLFGFDPDGDHQRITREMATRRVNLALPHDSLLVLKGAGKVPHTGGERFKPGDDEYNALIRWL